jgi:hypothetical protein
LDLLVADRMVLAEESEMSGSDGPQLPDPAGRVGAVGLLTPPASASAEAVSS